MAASSEDEDQPESSFNIDAVAAPSLAAAGPRRGRPTSVHLLRDGPCKLVVIIGSSCGRWRDPPACMAPNMNEHLHDCGQPPLGHDSYSRKEDGIVGFLICVQWRFVLPDAVVSAELAQFMDATRASRSSRAHMGFLEIPVKIAGILEEVAPLLADVCFRNGDSSPSLLAAVASLRASGARIESPSLSGAFVSLDIWLTEVLARFELSLDVGSAFAWKLCHPIAYLFCRGLLSSDVVLRIPRVWFLLGWFYGTAAKWQFTALQVCATWQLIFVPICVPIRGPTGPVYWACIGPALGPILGLQWAHRGPHSMPTLGPHWAP
jgi:hypothetical protein